jgi:anti-anti-sigma factor
MNDSIIVNISEEKKSGVNLVQLVGAIDELSHTLVENKISPLLAANKVIVVDCSGLNYINSTGLALFLNFYICAKNHGGGFKLYNLQSSILDVMTISGATKLLEIYNSQNEALESVEK